MYQMHLILYPEDTKWTMSTYTHYVINIYKNLTSQEILENWRILEKELIDLAKTKDEWISDFFKNNSKKQLNSNINWKAVPTLKELGLAKEQYPGR